MRYAKQRYEKALEFAKIYFLIASFHVRKRQTTFIRGKGILW